MNVPRNPLKSKRKTSETRDEFKLKSLELKTWESIFCFLPSVVKGSFYGTLHPNREKRERGVRLNLYVCKSHDIIFYPSPCESIVTFQLPQEKSVRNVHCGTFTVRFQRWVGQKAAKSFHNADADIWPSNKLNKRLLPDGWAVSIICLFLFDWSSGSSITVYPRNACLIIPLVNLIELEQKLFNIRRWKLSFWDSGRARFKMKSWEFLLMKLFISEKIFFFEGRGERSSWSGLCRLFLLGQMLKINRIHFHQLDCSNSVSSLAKSRAKWWANFWCQSR